MPVASRDFVQPWMLFRQAKSMFYGGRPLSSVAHVSSCSGRLSTASRHWSDKAGPRRSCTQVSICSLVRRRWWTGRSFETARSQWSLWTMIARSSQQVARSGKEWEQCSVLVLLVSRDPGGWWRLISLARGARLLQATIFACKRRISSSVSRPTAELCRVEFKPNYCQKTFPDRAHEIDANGFRVSKISWHLKRRRILGMDRGCHIPQFHCPRGARVEMMTKKKLEYVCVMLVLQP